KWLGGAGLVVKWLEKKPEPSLSHCGLAVCVFSICSGKSFPSLTVRTCSNESSLPSFDNPYTTCVPCGDARHQSSEKWLDPLLSLVGSTRTRSCPASRTKSLKLSAPSGRCWKNNFPPLCCRRLVCTVSPDNCCIRFRRASRPGNLSST